MDANKTNRASLALCLRFAFRSKLRCDYFVFAQPFIAFIIFYGKYTETRTIKGGSLSFLRLSLSISQFHLVGPISFAKKSMGALQFRLTSKAVSIFPSPMHK